MGHDTLRTRKFHEIPMKKDTHPQYFEDAIITCACGASYSVGSTKKTISVELCAACHPFYTGTQTIIDTARRVEKFTERLTKKTGEIKNRATKRVEKSEKRKSSGPKVEVEEKKSVRISKKKSEPEK